MKKYKRTRIVASLAVISSLAFTSTTFGATSVPIGSATQTSNRHPTQISMNRSVHAHKPGSLGGFRRENSVKRIFGTVSAVSDSGFTVDTRQVVTTKNTVYLKNRKLDASVDVSVGQRVSVIGAVNTDGVFEAKGVNLIVK